MLHIESALQQKWPNLPSKPIYPLLINLLKKWLHEDDINDFITEHQHLKGFAFLDAVLAHFDFQYELKHSQLRYIPASGRVIIVANHPIGSLDGLALLKLVQSVRHDVKIVANDMLMHITPLQSLFLQVDNLSARAKHKQSFEQMIATLEQEHALIIFPAGEVSRIKPNGVKDGLWKSGFLKLAQRTQSPILPILIEARNSALFYALSTLYKPLGSLMLVQEMFNKQQQSIRFHISKPIPFASLQSSDTQGKALAKQFRKYLYRLADSKKLHKKPFLETIETISHPIDSKALKQEIKKGQRLGETGDGKLIYLFDYDTSDLVMSEIGRLRELSFRAVDEGTGQSYDLDRYDRDYQHLVLWDEQEWEIVGAYRMGNSAQIIEQQGVEALYCSSLFEFNSEMMPYLKYGLELGRSFVQPKYWGKRSLDYLWYGIGAYLQAHPHIRYLFGPVSLSNNYPQQAKELITAFYAQQFGHEETLVTAKRPFHISSDTQIIASKELNGDYQESYKKLNALLTLHGVKVPTLFKQYSELCDDKGCRFIDFNIDPDFNHCVDAFILVDLAKVKSKKRQRYLANNFT